VRSSAGVRSSHAPAIDEAPIRGPSKSDEASKPLPPIIVLREIQGSHFMPQVEQALQRHGRDPNATGDSHRTAGPMLPSGTTSDVRSRGSV